MPCIPITLPSRHLICVLRHLGWYFNGTFTEATPAWKRQADLYMQAGRFSTAMLRAVWSFNDAYSLMCAKSDVLKDNGYNLDSADSRDTDEIARHYCLFDPENPGPDRDRSVIVVINTCTVGPRYHCSKVTINTCT